MNLTDAVNFGIGFTFSKGPESAFSEGLAPAPGPLYNVCRYVHAIEYGQYYC